VDTIDVADELAEAFRRHDHAWRAYHHVRAMAHEMGYHLSSLSRRQAATARRRLDAEREEALSRGRPERRVEANLVRLSSWIDAPSAEQDKLTQLLLRVGKLTEESGEVWDALIGVIGQNPRKGVYATWEDVDKELLDVIVTAWGALEHRHGNKGVAAEMLSAFVRGLVNRAGIGAINRPAVAEGDRVRVLEWDTRDALAQFMPPPPFEGKVAYVGTKNYAGQPSFYWGNIRGAFASSWETLSPERNEDDWDLDG
jgi:hypothetical protein